MVLIVVEAAFTQCDGALRRGAAQSQRDTYHIVRSRGPVMGAGARGGRVNDRSPMYNLEARYRLLVRAGSYMIRPDTPNTQFMYSYDS